MSDTTISRGTFEELTRMYHRRVLKTALSLTRDHHLAADVVQNTFLRAWTKRHTLRDVYAFGRWIEVICRRECQAEWKSNEREQPLDETAEASLAEHDDRNSGLADEKVVMLYAGLARLSTADVELLALKYFSGYSMRQISIWLGIQEKTVKSRLHDARRRLQKALKGITDVDAHSLSLQFTRRREMIMDKLNMVELGSHCLVRMSMKGQEAMLHSARQNATFADNVLEELKIIDKGPEFLTMCEGKVGMDEFMWILANCDHTMAERLLSPAKTDIDKLLDAAPGGYTIREAAPIMTVPDMEKTIAWFDNTMGWSGGIDARDETGRATYGCVFLGVPEAINKRYRGFHGIHLFHGDPPDADGGYRIAFLYVVGLERLHKQVTGSGWTQITDITSTPWATGVCELTTMDNYILRLFATD